MKDDIGIGRKFIEKTRYNALGASDQQKGLPQPPLEMPWDASAPAIDLPRREDLDVGHVDLAEAIEKRESVRAYSPAALSFKELRFLLRCTQGVKRVMPGVATFRMVPSAGARHALETYLLVNRVEDMDPGLYRFIAIGRKFVKLRPMEPAGGAAGGEPGANLMEEFTEACMGQAFIRSAALVFIWVADAYRMTYRYGQRGYRYLYLDAGHVCQNLYLAAEAVGVGACAIGAYDDDRVDSLVGVDGKNQFAIYIATVGKKA